MKILNNFQEALDYVNRLGFAGSKGPGWIPVAQGRMCDVINELESAVVGKPKDEIKWPGESPYPFRVRFHRPTRCVAGNLRYGSFLVEKDGHKNTVECFEIRSL